MAKPFTEDFPSSSVAGAHSVHDLDWSEHLPGDVPGPAIPDAPEAAGGPDVDPDTLPDGAPPIDLVTGLPNAALSVLSDEVPDEAEEHAVAVHADPFGWI